MMDLLRHLLRRPYNFVRGGPPSFRLVFLHVPKTGGTSLDHALERIFGPTSEGNLDFAAVTAALRLLQSYAPDQEHKHQHQWLSLINTVLCYKIARGAPYLSGHFAVTEELLAQAGPAVRFVTLLRDPAARWKSNYVYSRIRQAQDGRRGPVADIALELEEFIESPQAVEEGAKYVRYLGGFRHPDSLGDGAVIAAAKGLLSSFDVVGTLEQLPAFEQRLSALLGRSVRVPHLRKAADFREPGGRTSADYNALFTEAVNARVRVLCAPDYALYRHALALQHESAVHQLPARLTPGGAG